MKNIEYLVKTLTAMQNGETFIDDGGADEESVVFYNIACPYNEGDKRAECYNDGESICRKTCSLCKYKWLDQEVDE